MSSPGTALMLLSSMLVMLTLSVMKDWFRIAKRPVLIYVWGIVTVLPVLGLLAGYFGNWMAAYQKERITAILLNRTDPQHLSPPCAR